MNKNVLNSIPIEKQKTNVFDLSHDLKFSFNMGKLVPTTVIDTIPGDSFTIGFENMLRFAALVAPIMHRVKVSTHYFFVPNRIIWDEWERWITGAETVENFGEPPYFIPKFGIGATYGVKKGSLCDYMGIPPFGDPLTPPPTTHQFKINALPFLAYWRIFYEYYMDQNNDPDFTAMSYYGYGQVGYGGDISNNPLVPASDYYTTFGVDCASRLADRAWMHDYFTSALPWAQKGDDVYIPLSHMPVNPLFLDDEDYPREQIFMKLASTGALTTGAIGSASGGLTSGGQPAYWAYQYAENVMEPGQVGDGTINNLRRAFAIQSWLEKNARGGTRYAENILVHFGVRSSDARLQRPEYLGGSVQNMVISEVLSTAQTLNSTDEVVNPVGQLSGHGLSVGGSRVLNYRCEEHGWIIGLISVMPDTAYQDGIPKKFSKFDRFEYFWPSFQHIGEQAILNQELLAYPNGTKEQNESIFGYVPRYTEYKYENSRVAGDFRDTLDFWHLGRKFQYDETNEFPQLNADFIYPGRFNALTEEDPFNRIFAVSSFEADTIYAHVLNVIKARRPMAQYGIPSI